MASAAMVPAGMLPALMTVVVAVYVRVKGQPALQQCLYRCVCLTGHTAVQPDSGLCQGHLGASADSAADQGIYAMLQKKACQGPMAASVGVYHLLPGNSPVCDLIDLELLRVSKMLENLSILIGYCY